MRRSIFSDRFTAATIARVASATAVWVSALAMALILASGQAAGQDSTSLTSPPPGEIWVYPQGVFPDDFYSLWLAINGTPFVSGDLPFPYYNASDNAPQGVRPVFFGKPDAIRNWTVVLKTRRLVPVGDGQYTQGDFTAFNLGLAAGTRITTTDPVPPVSYWLCTDKHRFSTGFGDLSVRRPVEIRGEMTPEGAECFFKYTPNFDPAANPDTNPAFGANWLPAEYPRGSEYQPGEGFGIRSSKSVIYGGYIALHVRPVNVDLSVSDCLLYGQYGIGIGINTGPNCTLVSNVDIKHTYHCLQANGNTIGLLTWAISIQNQTGGGGKHLIEGCTIDQSPTWQEYWFEANSMQQGYSIGYTRGSHAVFLYYQLKEHPTDFVRIENSILTNCGSNCVVYQQSNVDLQIANCAIDGGYFKYTPTRDSSFPDWRGNCIIVLLPLVDNWGKFPAVDIARNQLVARGWSAWGARLFGCGHGEVTVEDNEIECLSASAAGYAGGIEIYPSSGVGSSGNEIARNTIHGTGGWAISVDTYDVPCEQNLFVDNDLTGFFAQEEGAVFFGPQANYNLFEGGVGDGIIDLGTGNVVK